MKRYSLLFCLFLSFALHSETQSNDSKAPKPKCDDPKTYTPASIEECVKAHKLALEEKQWAQAIRITLKMLKAGAQKEGLATYHSFKKKFNSDKDIERFLAQLPVDFPNNSTFYNYEKLWAYAVVEPKGAVEEFANEITFQPNLGYSLGELPWPPELVKQFAVALFHSKQYAARKAAMDFIVKQNFPERKSLIMQGLSDSVPLVKAAAIAAAAQTQDESFRPKIEKLSKEQNGMVQRAALEALGKFPDNKDGSLWVKKLKSKDEDEVTYALYKLADKKYESNIKEIHPVLKHVYPGIRINAAITLCKIGNENSKPFVAELEKDEETSVKNAATQILKVWGKNTRKGCESVREN